MSSLRSYIMVSTRPALLDRVVLVAVAAFFLCAMVNPVQAATEAFTSPRGIYSVVSSGAHLLFRVNPYSLRVCDVQKQRISLLSYIETVRGNEIKEWDVVVPIPPDDAKKTWSSHKAKAWVRGRIIAFRTQKGDVIWLFTDLDSEKLSKAG